MTARGVLAIDFGTANTYYSKCAGDGPAAQGVDFGEGRDGLATAILYRNGRRPLVGSRALHEFNEATPAERSGYELRTHFKPDLASSSHARQSARDFLAAILDEARRGNLDIEPTERQVIFGVPSEADAGFRKALSEVAAEAGYGSIELVDEPKGALLHHVARGDIPPRDALEGILVVDFGGGTCDFAYMVRGTVQHSWGEMWLGGRLFDDLFFQWFCEQNPDALARLRAEHAEYFALAFWSRETKELFSRAMARDRAEVFVKRWGEHGRLTGLTWDDFMRRARSYRPSETFRAQLGDAATALLAPWESGAPVDLIEAFRLSLMGGLSTASAPAGAVRQVILAGGSSLWPFVAEILAVDLGVAPASIRRSDRPYAAISEGLAVLPAQRQRFAAIRADIERDFPSFRDGRLRAMVRQRVETAAADIAESITTEVFDGRVKPALLALRAEGGSVAALRRRLSSEAPGELDRPRTVAAERLGVLVAGLPQHAAELTSAWLKSHGVTTAPPQWSLHANRIEEMPDVQVPAVFDDAMKVAGALVTTIAASIGGMAAGGAKLALIAAGPVGWLIGALLAGVAAFLAFRYGKARAAAMAEEWHAPAWLVRRLLTDKKIDESRHKMSADARDRILEQLAGLQGQLNASVDAQVRAELDALTEMNGL